MRTLAFLTMFALSTYLVLSALGAVPFVSAFFTLMFGFLAIACAVFGLSGRWRMLRVAIVTPIFGLCAFVFVVGATLLGKGSFTAGGVDIVVDSNITGPGLLYMAATFWPIPVLFLGAATLIVVFDHLRQRLVNPETTQ